ncbi:hypothetical protein ABL78_5077 [Leptomonas seymouri]|uniref:Uncharacterized protein n=1 Tax=Leptomonas seymouri TaxID=5684 RepID=A0A0N0P5D0_LEPSE|nr:hypothetical protein ABL78_5077 [Leptomonas seymouri]|eukprot:KPI85857.1 hypothetical protein ABL78_5077 [Leptomonas seymouri]
MPPLTLEQVLARSMRLPRRRTQRYASSLYRSSNLSAVNTHTQRATRAGALDSELMESGLFNPSHTDAASPRDRRDKAFAASALQEKLNFFELMEREDASRRAGRLSIRRSDQLVRNSSDLTTFLNAALRTGDWQDGLRVFAGATALPAFQALLQESSATPSVSGDASALHRSGAAPNASSGLPISLPGVNPNAGHVLALLDMCARADQYQLVESIGVFFAPSFPEAFARAVELLAARAATTTSSSAPGWRAAFVYLTQRCPLPAAEIPVEAFDVCLRGCEETKDWRGALEVVRAMGPNPLQGWVAADEDVVRSEGVSSSATATPASSSGTPSDACFASAGAASRCPEDANANAPAASTSTPTSLSTPPSPTVVSYATLIATLEQAGKDHIALEVLNRLPALEKEEITASYAALIMVWANQVVHKHRRRF